MKEAQRKYAELLLHTCSLLQTVFKIDVLLMSIYSKIYILQM